MRRRAMKGIPIVAISFGDVDASPFAPLHRRLGIKTYVHRQAILDDPRLGRRYDWIARAWNHQHAYRESITLAGGAGKKTNSATNPHCRGRRFLPSPS